MKYRYGVALGLRTRKGDILEPTGILLLVCIPGELGGDVFETSD